MKDTMTFEETAAFLGVRYSSAYRFFRIGSLDTVKEGRRKMVTRESAEKLKAARNLTKGKEKTAA